MNNRRGFYLALGVVLLTTITTEFIYGNFGKLVYQQKAELKKAGVKLQDLPKSFGRWEWIEDKPFERDVLSVLQCTRDRHINRLYENKDSGQTITVALIVGPPGPMVSHVPEICFSSRNFELQGDSTTEDIEIEIPDGDSTTSQTHQFRTAQFKDKNVDGQRLICYYAWTRGGDWVAPDNARTNFSLNSELYLYKIQVVATEQSEAESKETAEQTRLFLKDFLPMIQPRLFSGDEATQE